MIYASCSKVLNLSKKNAFDLLQNVIYDSSSYSDKIENSKIIEDYYDGYLRSINLIDGQKFSERVFIIKESSKIVTRLEQHSMYKGESVFQIIAPDDELLSDKKVTLTAVLIWRIHPGLVEAPITSKQDYLEDMLSKIQEKANKDLDLSS
jgi:hypothetical protein